MARTRCYRDGVLIGEDFDLSLVSEHLAATDTIVWVDLCAPDAAELTLVASELGVHELAVEDAIHRHQRPKLDRYHDHAFLSAYSTRFDPDTANVTSSEIAAFITRRVLVTIRGDDDFDMAAVVAVGTSRRISRNTVSPSFCTVPWTFSWMATSTRSSPSTARSRNWRTNSS